MPDSKNERLALLLGWASTPQGWWMHKIERTSLGIDRVVEHPCPDYTQWERFPEMQEYVRGLTAYEQDKIARWFEFNVDADSPAYFAAFIGARDITPTILGDAILEVTDA